MERLNSRWTKPLIAITLLGVIGGQPTCCRDDAPRGAEDSKESVRKKPLDWGLYQILWSRRYQDILEREISRFASRPKYVTFYRDLSRPFPTTAVRAIAAHGAVAVVSLELWSWHGRRRESYLPMINAGEFDAAFRRWAGAARDHGGRVLLRFGFEFNGDWFSWSGDPPAFVAAWRRAYDIFRQVRAENVEWVWAPNVVSIPETPENDMHGYYPGDDYVDWIGVDGYNFGDHHDKWHKWQSFPEIYATVRRDFQQRYAAMPVMITEFGCAPGEPGQREKWIRDAFETLQSWPQVEAVIWFNFDKRREGEPDWRLVETDGSLAVFNETFAKPG